MLSDYEYIGSEIKRIRKSKGLSQKDLAKFAGISEESLRRIENNYNNPRFDNLDDILNALGIDFEITLMNEKGSSRETINNKINRIDRNFFKYQLSKSRRRHWGVRRLGCTFA